MKRKDLEEVYDEFMDFSLSSPARKIRRLDAGELPPTMELVETASAMPFDDAVSCVSDIVMPNWESVHKDDSPPYPSYNEERAIVLYKPVESPLFFSPGSTNLSLRVASDFIHCLKNRVLNPGNQRFHAEEEETEADSSSLAIVPWAPSQAAMAIGGFAPEPMEAEDAEVTSMQVLKVSTKMQSHLEDTSLRHRSPEFSERGKKRSLHMIDGDPMYCGNQSIDGHSKELVLYDPGTSGMSNDTPAVTNHIENYTPTLRNFLAPNPSNRAYSAIGTFTVQCASCFKWRIIPTKEKYEQIREKILEEYFVCEHAREWRPTIRCEDPEDISQDGSRVWAIDKPNIAQPPSGWERLLRIRGEGGTKFADVYYTAPSGKKLRSMVEVQRYLLEHPEYARQGVTLSQFSFQAPRPLQENYVRKRPVRFMNPSDGSDLLLQRPLEVEEVIPLSCAAPFHKEQLVGAPASPNTFPDKPFPSPPNESAPPTAMPPREQMKLNNELASNVPFNPLFWPAAHTHKEPLVGAPASPNAASDKHVSYPNDMAPLTDLPPSEQMKLTNEHPARASSFNPFSWATLPANKELNLGGAPAPLNTCSIKSVSSLSESIVPTSLSPEEMKLKDEHPTNPSFNPFSWVDLPTYKDLAIGGPASGSTTPEELVSSPPNESMLPSSMPPSEQMKLKDKRPADASACEL